MFPRIVVEDEKHQQFLKIPCPDIPDSLGNKHRELRIKLENWKEILLPLYNILIWEKQWYPFATVGAITSVFLFIWFTNMSVLTAFSLLGLIVTVSDYFVPIFLNKLRKPDSWTPENETAMETVCSEILFLKKKIDYDCSVYSKMREDKPKMSFVLTTFILVMLAYFGHIFNNLLMVYLVLSSIILVPGARRTKLYHRIHEIHSSISEEYFNARSRNDARKEE